MYNNGFPVSYPQMTWPYQQQQQMPGQGMSPPTIHADIVQVSGEAEAMSYPVAAGSSQMMMDKDDSAIYIKFAYANSQPTLEIFRKQEAKTQESGYVTKAELEEAIAALKAQSKSRTKEAEA